MFFRGNLLSNFLDDFFDFWCCFLYNNFLGLFFNWLSLDWFMSNDFGWFFGSNFFRSLFFRGFNFFWDFNCSWGGNWCGDWCNDFFFSTFLTAGLAAFLTSLTTFLTKNNKFTSCWFLNFLSYFLGHFRFFFLIINLLTIYIIKIQFR